MTNLALNLALTLEYPSETSIRAIIIDLDADGDGTGHQSVRDIAECDTEDGLWVWIADNYPNLNTVLVDGEPVAADCLTLREAAETSFPRGSNLELADALLRGALALVPTKGDFRDFSDSDLSASARLLVASAIEVERLLDLKPSEDRLRLRRNTAINRAGSLYRHWLNHFLHTTATPGIKEVLVQTDQWINVTASKK